MLLVALVGLLSMASLATAITENQGHLGARTTEYAQDKMEQLLELTYGDAQSDTTVFPVGHRRRHRARGRRQRRTPPLRSSDTLTIWITTAHCSCGGTSPATRLVLPARSGSASASLRRVRAVGQPQADHRDGDRQDRASAAALMPQVDRRRR